MTVDEAIRTRRSVRGFKPDPIPEDELREIVEVALWAPSNCNVQPWNVHIVSGETLRQLRDALVEASSQGVAPDADWPTDIRRFSGIYRERQVDAGMRLYGAMGIERGDQQGRKAAYIRNYAFFDAPHVVFIFLPRPFDIREATDMGMFAQSLMLALTARGYASCAQGALGEYPAIVRRHLGLEADQRLLFGISIGIEDPDVKANAARIGRASFGEIVRFHR